MDDVGSKYPLAYCTNVHAGVDFAEMFANLSDWVPRVQDYRSQRGPMGIGLWFSERAVADAQQREPLQRLRDWLVARSLIPFTANAFPQGNFHQPIVKYDVYRPDWTTSARRDYTLSVIRLMDALAPADCDVSVSTLPLGWPRPTPDESFFQACAVNLLTVAKSLGELERSSGRLVYLCLEPEPGCVLDSSEDLVRFFQDWLLVHPGESELVRRYLRVCHDVCHSAVMFESQVEAIQSFRQSGIAIGKVQLSAAVDADFGGRDESERSRMSATLRLFHEPRYLHQTSVRRRSREPSETLPPQTTLYDDLSAAFAAHPDPTGTHWRTHFHVPIFMHELGPLRTTNDQIDIFLRAIGVRDAPKHFEVETYAWNVLPPSHLPEDLAAGIAAELDWVNELRRK